MKVVITTGGLGSLQASPPHCRATPQGSSSYHKPCHGVRNNEHDWVCLAQLYSFIHPALRTLGPIQAASSLQTNEAHYILPPIKLGYSPRISHSRTSQLPQRQLPFCSRPLSSSHAPTKFHPHCKPSSIYLSDYSHALAPWRLRSSVREVRISTVQIDRGCKKKLLIRDPKPSVCFMETAAIRFGTAIDYHRYFFLARRYLPAAPIRVASISPETVSRHVTGRNGPTRLLDAHIRAYISGCTLNRFTHRGGHGPNELKSRAS